MPEARLSSSVNDSDAVQFHQRVADNAVFADEGGGRFRTDVIRCKCRRQKDFGRANCSVVLIVYRVARVEISFKSLHVSDLEILEAAGVEPASESTPSRASTCVAALESSQPPSKSDGNRRPLAPNDLAAARRNRSRRPACFYDIQPRPAGENGVDVAA